MVLHTTYVAYVAYVEKVCEKRTPKKYVKYVKYAQFVRHVRRVDGGVPSYSPKSTPKVASSLKRMYIIGLDVPSRDEVLL